MDTRISNGKKSIPSPLPSLLTLSLCMLGLSSIEASTLTVNNLTEIAVAADGQCTLREAVANATANSDTTGGDCAAGTGADRITFGLSGTLTLGSPLVFTASEALMLDGAGQKVILNGGNAVQIIRVNPSAVLTVNNLTLSNGFVASSGFGGSNGGGALLNQDGNVTVMNSTFTGNTTTGSGGAIYNANDSTTVFGLMEIFNSTFSGNTAFLGGALANGSNALLTLVHTTVVGNHSVTPLCPVGQFCATVISDGGGMTNGGFGTLTLINNIIAGNTNVIKTPTSDLISASDVSGFGVRGNNNLIGTSAGILGGLANGVDNNVIGIDVNTIVDTALVDHGGSAQTLALVSTSPAKDAASAVNCLATDQRGVSRPQGSACDIGAFETALSADLAVSQSASPNPVDVRDAIAWTLVATNHGPADAINVRLVNTLPAGAGLSSISASPSQGACAVSAGLVTCNLGALANAASATVTVRAVTSKTGTLLNNVSVSSDQPDTVTTNNAVALSTNVQALLCNGLRPTLVGTPGNDILRGSSNKDIIHGLGGNDTISGGGGNDVICGGEGQDNLKGEGGNDTLNGGAGSDTCDGGTGTDTATNCEVRTAVP